MSRLLEEPPVYTPSPGMEALRACPPLQSGDHLDAAEFLRRYEGHEARGEHIKAELISGIVYIVLPAHYEAHGKSDSILQYWLAHYATFAQGTDHAINATVMLNIEDVPQPDGFLWDTTASNARVTPDDYLEGAPELIVETSATSVSYDSRQKLEAYLRAGVREYIIWRTLDGELDWFVLEQGKYVRQQPDAGGILRSRHFQGLWLNVTALFARDRRGVLRTLEEGLAAAGMK
jgi:Uma2 family endonuclease